MAIGQGVISYAISANCLAEDGELFCQLLANAGLLLSWGWLNRCCDRSCRLWASLCLPFYRGFSRCRCSDRLPRERALKMAAQTVVGAGQMVPRKPATSWVLKDQVCSPGGSISLVWQVWKNMPLEVQSWTQFIKPTNEHKN